MKQAIISFMYIILFCMPSIAMSEKLSGRDIMKKVLTTSCYAADNGRLRATMKTQKNGKITGIRDFATLYVTEKNPQTKKIIEQNQHWLIYFFDATYKGTTFYVNTLHGKEDNRYYFQPKISKVMKLKGKDEFGTLAGSITWYINASCSYELDDNLHKVIKLPTTKHASIKIRSRPRVRNHKIYAPYHYFISHIDPKTYIVKRIEYYRKGIEKPFRISVARKIEIIDAGNDRKIPTITEGIVMEANEVTHLKIHFVEYNNPQIQQKIIKDVMNKIAQDNDKKNISQYIPNIMLNTPSE
jgi:hypothetical protein